MLFESKRLMELAGIKGETPGMLTEGKVADEETPAEECDESDKKEEEVSEADKAKDRDESEEEIREAVRNELQRMWASGEVFGKRATNKAGQVTMGFPGVGFKK